MITQYPRQIILEPCHLCLQLRLTATGLERLRAYRKRWNRSLNAYTGPLHDSASHGADAFGEFAVNRRKQIATASEDHRGKPSRRGWAG